jgi:hypothetical protein
MPRDFDIHDQIDDLLRRLEAKMDTPEKAPRPEQSPHSQEEANQQHIPAKKAEEEAKYMESPTMLVYIFDATKPPPSSPFARWESMPPQTGNTAGPWEGDVVDSTLEAEVTEAPATDEEDAIPVDVPPSFEEEADPSRHRRRRRTVGVLVALAGVTLVVVLLVALYVVPLLTASASITLIPEQTPVSATTTLSVVTAGTGPALASGQVPGRLLSTLTVSGERTVATTGMGHADAQAAHGTLTFYNAALSAQTIPAGTVLVGSDGVQVVTDNDAVIPAAVLPTDGQVTVAAHAVQAGPTGNIAAGDIYSPCCRVNVLVQNTNAFVGGQNARSYPMVTHSDITSAVNALTASLTGSVQAALGTQAHADETLITPVPCASQVHTNAAEGTEATHVTVQVSETCRGETYSTQAVENVISKQVTQVAQARLGAGYTREGAVQVTVQHVHKQTGPHGGLTLEVTGTSVWAYQFTNAGLTTLANRLEGMSRQQATAVLLATPGVSQVAMQVASNTDTLPTDASRIHLLVLYQP